MRLAASTDPPAQATPFTAAMVGLGTSMLRPNRDGLTPGIACRMMAAAAEPGMLVT